jgi:AmmeMemoRadiSam system protein A
MPHAPVLIPEVGNGREHDAGNTVDAMWRLAREIVESQPDSILVISPHAPRRPVHYGLCSGTYLRGDMGRFGQPDTRIQLKNDRPVATEMAKTFRRHGLQTWEIAERPLDHGAFVPLYFLTRSGWDGPTAILGLNEFGGKSLEKAGYAIREAIHISGRRTAIIASGDMSHSLLPDAPCGFQARAREFDETFVERMRSGDFSQLSLIDPDLRELASEDVVDSTLIAVNAVEMSSQNHEVLSYEGPFGVGYCVARLFGGDKARSDGGRCLPTVARDAVKHRLSRRSSLMQWPANDFLKQSAGVFVTIRRRSGELRGCRGTIEPRHENLIKETQAVALSSAFNDSRFEPVYVDELDDLRYEVSVLYPAIPVASRADLDPHQFGVIITTPDGRRGLMLPEVAGLDTVDKQIEETCKKAHIDPREPMSFERFEVEKFKED